MSLLSSLLAFVRDLLGQAQEAPDSDYRAGYVDSLREVEEEILDRMWQEGEDDDE